MGVFKNKILLAAFIVSAVLIIVGLSIFYVELADIRHLLIIHFDGYRGIDFLGSKRDVLDMLVSGITLNLINLFLASLFYNRERFLSYLIAVINILVTLLILLAVIVIVSIN